MFTTFESSHNEPLYKVSRNKLRQDKTFLVIFC